MFKIKMAPPSTTDRDDPIAEIANSREIALGSRAAVRNAIKGDHPLKSKARAREGNDEDERRDFANSPVVSRICNTS